VTSVDVHLHLWPEEVLRALEGRTGAPSSRWADGTWAVTPAREPAFAVPRPALDAGALLADLEAREVEGGIVALSPPAGVEDAAALDAWEAAAQDFPPRLGWWASLPAGPAEEQVPRLEAALDAGASGLCLPAGRLATPATARNTLPLLTVLAARGVPLFVHPGAAETGSAPAWWGPSGPYVAETALAWLAVAAEVRPVLPHLPVLWAILAGLAPLHAERTALRGGPATGEDPWTFYEPSSYGPRAVRSLACAVGTGQLVYGSDRPSAPAAVDPIGAAFGPAAADLARTDNAARLFGRVWQPV
jgi:hypothetical protein